MDFIDLIIWPLGTPFVDKPMWGSPHVDSQGESINPTLGDHSISWAGQIAESTISLCSKLVISPPRKELAVYSNDFLGPIDI